MTKYNITRPKTLKEVVEFTNSGEPFRHMLSEFMDSYYISKEENKQHFFSEEPALINKNNIDYREWQDSYIAAVAEHLSLMEKYKTLPSWINNKERFLKKAHFENSGMKSLNSILLVESPLAFRKRFIFTEKSPLRRASQNLNK